ncbi:D-glycero-alpha-D-manno-heptose-1,7-bisphosphate 7-phosphatase [Rhodovarius lipocyclicus]|uniref:D-glycero-alpha-D-manno-heptose-1,7-bisphosphate 7-phosphatase n=1 Tax=Rhodovarius lipocyclicus TaxID=268410 RepID=UPI0019179379|nr:HAD-IIIA family hydrolase [Rhodovarius lipocyclicus]
MRRAVFLDRDGVLNAALRDAKGRPLPPRDEAGLRILPGVPEACARLRAAGFLLIGATNQPDIARGTTPPELVRRLNALVSQAAGLDAMALCPHDDADGCGCRKPLPGLLTGAAEEHGIALQDSWMVGDRWRDIAAGQAAGCRTAFIQAHYAERQPEAPDITVSNLSEAVDHILSVPA